MLASKSAALWIGLSCLLGSPGSALAGDRYVFIDGVNVSRSKAASPENQTIAGVYTIGDRNTGSVTYCLASITYNRASGALVKNNASCEAKPLDDAAQTSSGSYTFYGPGASRAVTRSGTPDFASVEQSTGRLRFCAFVDAAPGRYACIEAPLKF
jgi:hypothetical protein